MVHFSGGSGVPTGQTFADDSRSRNRLGMELAFGTNVPSRSETAMKLTGIVVIALGLCGLMFGLTMGMQPSALPHSAETPAQTANLPIPVMMGLAAVVIGALILAFGGRGYFVSPREHVESVPAGQLNNP
jgi:hypothetical protein